MEETDATRALAPQNGSRPVDPIETSSVRLRLVEVEDAAFIVDLRGDERISRHLSAIDLDVSRQAEWLRKYLDREAAGAEYYFVIETKQGQAVGTVRLYEIEPTTFRWGSWIVRAGSPTFAAIESALAVYEFGFFRLKRETALLDVRKANRSVLRFHRRFGARETGTDELNVYFELTLAEYEKARANYSRLLEPES
jgi:RimJ/RimL family protein N-acetyltransferase